MGLLSKLGRMWSSTAEPKADREPERVASSADQADMSAMTLPDLVEFVRGLGDGMTAQMSMRLSTRLSELAFLDNHVPEEQRAAAAQLLKGVRADLEAGLANNAEAMKIYRDFAAQTEVEIRHRGVGSIAWQLKEINVPDADVMSFVMHPSRGHLLQAFVEIMSDETLARLRPNFIRELISARKYRSGDNAVLNLHGLATSGDPAAVALFGSSELAALINVPQDYEPGRRLLVELGLLPPQSGASPFPPGPAVEILAQAVVFSVRNNQVESDDNDPALRAYVESLDEDHKKALKLTALVLRIHLGMETVRGIFGADIANAVERQVLATFVGANEQGLSSVLPIAKAVRQVVIEQQPGVNLDLLFLDSVICKFEGDRDLEALPDEEKRFLLAGARWINRERILFLQYFRCMLRTFASGRPPEELGSGVIIEDVLL
jgi:hypothetical protein